MERASSHRHEPVGRDGMQVTNLALNLHILTASLNQQLHFLPNTRIQNVIQPDELGEKLSRPTGS
jgi:hypothetical protein